MNIPPSSKKKKGNKFIDNRKTNILKERIQIVMGRAEK